MSSDAATRLRALLAGLYGPELGAATYGRLLAQLDAFAAMRPPVAHRPHHERLTQDDVILITYGDQIREEGRLPLRSLGALLDGPLAGMVSGVHILPFYPSTSDDGFSVVDYLAVDPALGAWEDIAALGRGYRLMFDAVVNHVSASSAWFQAFLAGAPGAAGRFHVLDPTLDLSRVTRPRTTPLLTPFETAYGTQHVWTTFSADQIDLNFGSPDLLLEMTDVLLAYVGHGAALIRLDAIGYLWKDVGTRCIHLPQAHMVVQLWRAALDLVAPDVLLISETNVPHADNISYFGDGTNEAQLVYQFPLAPLTLHAFATGDATKLTDWARELAPPAPTTAFFNFLASHDGIGVVPATGILTGEEVAALCAQVERHAGRVSYKNNPDGTQSPYELNCTWFDALSDPAAAEPVGLAVARFVCTQAIMLALQGVPGIYIHSLLGSPNDHAGLERTGRARTLNREKWDWGELMAHLTDPARREGAVLARMGALLRARRAEPAFHPGGSQRILDLGPALFALERTPPGGGAAVRCLHNVSATTQTVRIALEPGAAYGDLLGGATYTADHSGALAVTLAPYQAAWLKAAYSPISSSSTG